MTENHKKGFNFQLITSQFSIEGGVAKVEPYGSGHIHDTFHVVNQHAESPDYLLQRINHHIFKNIPALTENVQRVTAHLRKKVRDIPGADPEKQVLTVVLTKQNNGYYKDPQGNFWRMYHYLKNTSSYDIVRTTDQAYQGGKAFGRFQALLSDLDASTLHETIPDFHDVESRLKLFNDAIARNPKGRINEAEAEIAFVKERSEAMHTISNLGREGKIPLRITHNDTKFNNVLLDDKDEAQCVIDLDTVMPGYIAYDFGDAIRTIVNKAAEDERDLEKVLVDMDLFRSFTRGFLEENGSFMSREELSSLAHGALLLPFIIGLRFLTDYIDGDNYFKVAFPEHNLQRARAQFRLVEKLEEQFDVMQDIIENMIAPTNEVNK